MFKMKTIETRCNFVNETYFYTLVIENFDVLPYMRNNPIYGPIIRLGKKNSTWQIKIYKYRKRNGLKSLKFGLWKADLNMEWDVCKYSVSVKSRDGVVNVKYVDNEIVGGQEHLEDGLFVNDEDNDADISQNSTNLLNTPPKEQHNICTEIDLIGDLKDLIVVYDIKYIYLNEEIGVIDLVEPNEKTIGQGLLELYESEKFCDIILCAGGKEFPAHKNILASRASGFDLLLQDTTSESLVQALYVDIPDSIAEFLLFFLYTGTLPEGIDFDICSKLQNVALKYGICTLEHYVKSKVEDKSVRGICHKDEGILISTLNGVDQDTSKESSLISANGLSSCMNREESKSSKSFTMDGANYIWHSFET